MFGKIPIFIIFIPHVLHVISCLTPPKKTRILAAQHQAITKPARLSAALCVEFCMSTF
jgi:hypothetical protein